MTNEKIWQALKTGAYVTASVIVLNLILSNFFNLAPKELFGIAPVTGITTTIGSKAIAMLQNLVAFDPFSIIYLYISAVLIVFIGTFAIDKLRLPDGRGDWQKIALTLFYGTIPFYLLLIGFGFPGVSTIIGLGLWYIGVALVLGGLQKLKVKIL